MCIILYGHAFVTQAYGIYNYSKHGKYGPRRKKSVFGVSDKARLKPFSATETS